MKSISRFAPLLLPTLALALTACGAESSKQDTPAPTPSPDAGKSNRTLDTQKKTGDVVKTDEAGKSGTDVAKPMDTTGIVVDADAYKFDEIYQDHTVTLDLAKGKAMFLSRFSTRLLFGRRVRLASDASVMVNGQALRYSDGSDADILSLFMPFFGTLLAQSVKDVYVLESTAFAPGARLDWSVRKGTQVLSSHAWSLPASLSSPLAEQAVLDRQAGFSVAYVAADLTGKDRVECELVTSEPSTAATDGTTTDTVEIVEGKAGVCRFEAAEIAKFRPGKAKLSLSRRRSDIEGRVYLSSKVQAAPVQVSVK